MTPARKRWIIVTSLVVVLALAAGSLLVIRAQQRSADVAKADRVARAFTKDVRGFRAEVSTALRLADRDKAAAMKADLEQAIADPPRLGKAPAWGRSHSASYLKAVEVQKKITEPYQPLRRALDETAAGQRYIRAAVKALRLEIDDFVGTGDVFYSGRPFRDKLVPGFAKALKKLDAVPVPRGQQRLSAVVRAALKTVMRQGEAVAGNLDSGRSGKIDAVDEYREAGKALTAYEGAMNSRLSEAVAKALAPVEDALAAT